MLEEGALQPVIGLLSSSCTESQRESALLLGQFATTDHEFKAKIVQRGAVPPLITMLGSSDVQLKEMAAFALGRLAQNVDNQAGIVQVCADNLLTACWRPSGCCSVFNEGCGRRYWARNTVLANLGCRRGRIAILATEVFIADSRCFHKQPRALIDWFKREGSPWRWC